MKAISNLYSTAGFSVFFNELINDNGWSKLNTRLEPCMTTSKIQFFLFYPESCYWCSSYNHGFIIILIIAVLPFIFNAIKSRGLDPWRWGPSWGLWCIWMCRCRRVAYAARYTSANHTGFDWTPTQVRSYPLLCSESEGHLDSTLF